MADVQVAKSDSPEFEQGVKLIKAFLTQVEVEGGKLAAMIEGSVNAQDQAVRQMLVDVRQRVRGLSLLVEHRSDEAILVTFGNELKDNDLGAGIDVAPHLKSLALAGDVEGLTSAINTIVNPEADDSMYRELLDAIADAGDARARTFLDKINALNASLPGAAERIWITVKDYEADALLKFASDWMTMDEAREAFENADPADFEALDRTDFYGSAVLAVSRETGTAPSEWESINGAETGVGVESWFRNSRTGAEAYVCDDQGDIRVEITQPENPGEAAMLGFQKFMGEALRGDRPRG